MGRRLPFCVRLDGRASSTGTYLPACHHHLSQFTEHTRVYLSIKQTPKAQFWRTLSAQMSVYGALFLVNFPQTGIHILYPVELKFELSKNGSNSPSRRGHFSREKCAIDRHLSTEGSPKLRLWRLFDRQIYTSVLGNSTETGSRQNNRREPNVTAESRRTTKYHSAVTMVFTRG